MPGMYVSLPHMTAWLEYQQDTGEITHAPPIARWTIGKDIDDIERYYQQKNATIVHLMDDGPPARIIKQVNKHPYT